MSKGKNSGYCYTENQVKIKNYLERVFNETRNKYLAAKIILKNYRKSQYKKTKENIKEI